MKSKERQRIGAVKTEKYKEYTEKEKIINKTRWEKKREETKKAIRDVRREAKKKKWGGK